MSIRKYEYELSVWKETLAEEGQRKEEKKMAIIGANDMDYAGRATKLKFITKINGTHTLTFEMPDKYFDSEKGDFIHNELVDALFTECKIKFHYKGKWYEFYIKNVSDKKNYKSYMRTYTCSDSFIDELSRNGYGITFDEELYNNVEEIGDFAEEILEDSVWEYDPHLNWGDFTEYLEEKLFKIPLSLFGNSLKAYKINYNTTSTSSITNIFNGDARAVEMGDDLAREEGQFWDSYNNDNPLMKDRIEITEGYIYVPYSQLDFCYITTSNPETYEATEEPAMYDDKGYAIAPSSIDPSALIQFIYIPEGAQVEVDEAGLIVNKNYTYVMTIADWNNQIKSKYFYYFVDNQKQKELKEIAAARAEDFIYGNWAAYYDGYLDKIGDLKVEKGKKISISDHTEINISDEVNQYVKVYKNKATEYEGLYSNSEWNFGPVRDKDYRVCSKIETRQVVPQLARNLVQNGVKISTAVGWEIMSSQVSEIGHIGAKIEFKYIDEPIDYEKLNNNENKVAKVKETFLSFSPAYKKQSDNIFIPEEYNNITEQNAVVNFGIVGQEKKILKDKTYALGINIKKGTAELPEGVNGDWSKTFIRIGNGELVSDGDYRFKENEYIDIPISLFASTSTEANSYILIKTEMDYENPYIAIYSLASYDLYELAFFEAYTKGIDQFESARFRYSGRDLFSSYTPLKGSGYTYSMPQYKEFLQDLILFEDDIMPGDTYEYTRYFIQALRLGKNVEQQYDTYKAKKYLSEDGTLDSLPLNASLITEDDYEILTNYIDLNQCENYNPEATFESCDCKYGGTEYNKVCLYQKYGYCPYRFQTEKHCRKIRTLKAEKSNRFNLTQEMGKVFSIYPVYWTSHSENGKVLSQQEAYNLGMRAKITEGRAEWMDKRLFFITEKGKTNQLGFRYEKNITDISRTINSDKIVSKLYVLDVDSEISKTGMCSIKTAEDNPSKDNFIIDFSYYIKQGLLDEEKTNADLYGKDENDLGYLKTLGYYNTQYDKISNQIINLSAASFTELKANLDVNLTGIETAQKKLRDLEKRMNAYIVKLDEDKLKDNSTYMSYKYEYAEQYSIFIQLIFDTFYTNGKSNFGFEEDCPPNQFLDVAGMSIEEIREKWVGNMWYRYGILGQYNREYYQLQEWLKEQASYLKQINNISSAFYRKYEPYLKEGTWSDSNYVSDNAYYFGALKVVKDGAIPKVSYSISLTDIEPLYQEGDYDFEVADTTFIEDIGMFGVNQKTGLPNRLKTIVASIEEEPDLPNNNKINVQDFTTQFEDLFQQVTASVQSLTFNENIYKRSSNFTSQQVIKTESLQGALDNNNLNLVNTQENNIQINANGQSGSDINNHSNKYVLDGQGLRFSNNGGQSWNTAITPNGINTDFLRAGTIDASKIKIVDGKYVYFSWDMSGITAYRDPSTLSDINNAFDDYARFNKYGLSLVEGGNIRLRAGYAFNSVDGTGKANNEGELTENNPIGFYLYNSEGKAIFSTESSSTNDAKETARINLIGEILATNNTEITNFQGYLYGGTCYQSETRECAALGTDSDLVYNLQADYDYNTITFTMPTQPIATPIQYAAFLTYQYHSYGINQIVIIYEQNNIVFNNPQLIFNYEGFGEIESNNNIRYVNFSKYSVSFAEGEDQNFIVLESDIPVYKAITSLQSTEKVIFTTLIGNTDYSKTKLIKNNTLTGINLTTPNTDAIYHYYNQQSIPNLYKLQDNYYTQFINEVYYTDEGAVALYINNRQDLKDEAEKSSRLFVCCKGAENAISNIFSILKDGSLHMGGTIINQTDVTKLTDTIEIADEYLVIDENGKFKMSFDDIVDMRTEESIVDYISAELEDAAEQISQDVDAKINALKQREHRHYIDEAQVGWDRPHSLIDSEGNEIDFSEIMVSLSYNGDYSMSLEKLLETIHYYYDLSYGLIYTDYSKI